MLKDNPLDLFDVQDVVIHTQSENSGNDKFKPDPKSAKNNNWKAIVRFIPNLKDKQLSSIEKYGVYLTHPVTGDRRTVYTHRGQEGAKECPFYKAYFEFNNSKDARLKSLAPDLNGKLRKYMLVQVLKDYQNSDNDGKLMFWEMGYKVSQILKEEEFPTIGIGKKPIDVVNGRPFLVDTYLMNDMPQYDRCKFLNPSDLASGQNKIPLWIGPNGESLDILKNQSDAVTYGTYLKESTPDLSKFKFVEWDEDTRKFVNSHISALKNNNSSKRYESEMSSANSSVVDEDDVLPTKSSSAKVTNPYKDEIAADMNKSKHVTQPLTEDEEDDDDDNLLGSSLDDINLDELDL